MNFLHVPGAVSAPRPTPPAITARGLRKSYGRGTARVDALVGVDLHVEREEVVGILGPNGAGKTTLIEILEGQREPDSGSAEVLGVPVCDRARMKLQSSRIGVAFQHAVLPELLTVGELIEFQKSLFARTSDTTLLLDSLGLSHKRDTRIKHLSGGQQQRVTVALALIGMPEVVFLDEPTSALDPQARRAVWHVLERHCDRNGAGILLTTHQMEEAQRLCNRIVILDSGRVIAEGAPASLVERHCPHRIVQFNTTPQARLDFIDAPLDRRSAPAARSRVRVESPDANALVAELMDRARRGELAVEDVRVERQTLEDVFVKLTGRFIRH